ncbi:MAG: sulfite exporter TauE/SafE family protein [Clostridiales bacterium]|nr:sulfite exporter TauE/SafE family protein [Clostridiales bacterium]
MDNHKNYSSTARKYKVFADVITLVGLFGSAILGFVLWFSLGPLAVGIAVGGVLGSVFSYWFFHGLGELINNTEEIARNTATGASAVPLAAEAETDKELETLEALRKDDLISEDEYKVKKKRC